MSNIDLKNFNENYIFEPHYSDDSGMNINENWLIKSVKLVNTITLSVYVNTNGQQFK